MATDLSDIPGADHGWLRRLLLAPAIPDRPPLTLQAVRDVRRRLALHAEHGVLPAATARSWQSRLDVIEAELRETERGD